MDEQNAQISFEENRGMTQNEWSNFIRRQIEYEAERQKRLGISLWLICGSILLLGQRFLSNLYLIPSSEERINLTLTAAILVLAATTFLFTLVICIAQLFSRPKMLTRVTNHDRFLVQMASLVTMMLSYLITLGYLFIKGIYREYQTLMLINLVSTILLLRISNVSKSVFEIVAKNVIVRKFTLFFVKYFVAFDALLLGFASVCFCRMIIEISTIRCSLAEMEVVLIVPIISALVVLLAYILHLINVSNSYKELENEIVLSNLNTEEVLEVLKKYFYGYSAVEWFEAELKAAEGKRKDALDLLDKEFSPEGYRKVLKYLVEMRASVDGIVEYIDFAYKAMLLTYIEERYYKKSIAKIKDIAISIDQLLEKTGNNLNKVEQSLIIADIDSSI